MSTALAQHDLGSGIEQVLIGGDIQKLSPADRVRYYNSVCASLGLNPLTKPFDYITLNGKLTLYARRDATEQLRKIHGVSITQLEKVREGDLYIVTAYASDKTGRSDASTGAVTLAGLKGEALANAIMKAETKAKRRVTLSICGLGMLDETEAADVRSSAPAATVVVEAPVKQLETGETVHAETGEVLAEDGLLRVARVESRPTQTGKARWLVVLSDGREAWTFQQQLSGLAEQYAQQRVHVEAETKDKGKWGHDLVALRKWEPEDTHPPAQEPEPITADDIPFAVFLAFGLSMFGVLA